MSYELFPLAIFLISSFALLILLFRKIPQLLTFPPSSRSRNNFSRFFKKQITFLNTLKEFSYLLFLQKFLFKLRLLALKAENKTTIWLQSVRAKMREKEKEREKKDDYWKKLKRSFKKKKV